jgi:membrane protein implicated in regulation of membrane protease activity
MNMVTRVFFTVLSVVLAVFMMRFVLTQTRRARVSVRNDGSDRSSRRIARLQQDPATGVYYPADQ